MIADTSLYMLTLELKNQWVVIKVCRIYLVVRRNIEAAFHRRVGVAKINNVERGRI